MAKSTYYVNKNVQSNGDHEVHKTGCTHMPKKENRIYLGLFASCQAAVKEAKEKHYKKSNGCYYCCRACHTG